MWKWEAWETPLLNNPLLFRKIVNHLKHIGKLTCTANVVIAGVTKQLNFHICSRSCTWFIKLIPYQEIKPANLHFIKAGFRSTEWETSFGFIVNTMGGSDPAFLLHTCEILFTRIAVHLITESPVSRTRICEVVFCSLLLFSTFAFVGILARSYR